MKVGFLCRPTLSCRSISSPTSESGDRKAFLVVIRLTVAGVIPVSRAISISGNGMAGVDFVKNGRIQQLLFGCFG